MKNCIFTAPPQPTVPVAGCTAVFPVHRIYCVGRNYAGHAREMGEDPLREPPFFFCKPPDAVVPLPEVVDYPPRTSQLHHEIELVVAIAKAGADIPVDQAGGHVFGYAVGVDLTRRDLQQRAKDLRRPWDTGKGFDQSAPLSMIQPATAAAPLVHAAIWLKVNGILRQQGNVADMIWNISEIIAELSTLFTLLPGDLVFTGTPAGVGAIERGDVLEGGIDGVGRLAFRMV